MQRYYFDTSLAPISYDVGFLPLPVDDVARLFKQYVEGGESFQQCKSEKQCYLQKVSARRHELAGLLKPQNYLIRFVFVPTKSKWTAVFAPNSISSDGIAEHSLGNMSEFAYAAALEAGVAKYSPCYVRVKARPRRTREQAQGKHPIDYGDWGVNIYTTGTRDTSATYGSLCLRAVEGGGIHGLTIRSQDDGPLDWFGLSDMPEINVDLTSYLEENRDIMHYPWATQLLDVSDEIVDKVWESFTFDDIDYICRQLGIDVFDDAFYGTEGYLAQPWGMKQPYYEIVEDRIPFSTYQHYRGLLGDDVIRAWTSNPPATND